jgi:hypothetical protein
MFQESDDSNRDSEHLPCGRLTQLPHLRRNLGIFCKFVASMCAAIKAAQMSRPEGWQHSGILAERRTRLP